VIINLRLDNIKIFFKQRRKLRYKKYDKWHKHFAIIPVKMDDGSYVWLQFLERRISNHYNKPRKYFKLGELLG